MNVETNRSSGEVASIVEQLYKNFSFISQQLQSSKTKKSATATDEKVRRDTPDANKSSASKYLHVAEVQGAFSAREEKLHPFYKNLRSAAAIKGVASSSVGGASA